MPRPHEGPWQKCPPQEHLLLPVGQEALAGGHFCQGPKQERCGVAF